MIMKAHDMEFMSEEDKVQQFNSLMVRMNPDQESIKKIIEFASLFLTHKSEMAKLTENEEAQWRRLLES